MLKSVLSEVVNFILPNSCICCLAPIDASEEFICRKCYKRLERFEENHPWKEEFIRNGIIDNSLSTFWFREGTEIQTLLHSMKYEKLKSIGIMLGRGIGKRVSLFGNQEFDYITPVPLHKARVRDRSYNQSEFIAQGTAEELTSIVLMDLLIRNRQTKTQTKLNKPQRKENVKNAFEINPRYKNKIIGKSVLIVDDVITTGATILECAKVLKEAGTGVVWVCSAAYAALE